MIYFILSIIGIIATLIMKSTWNQRNQIFFIGFTLIIGLVIFFGMYFVLEEMGIIKKGGVSVLAQIPWREIGLYFSMIAGMTAKYLYDWIGNGNEKKKKFRKWQLFRPMFISPIVFGTVYGSIDPKTSTILLLIFAFQNGFFWQTILNKQSLESKSI